MSEDEKAAENITAPVPRMVSVNQVVAWNLAWYRRKAGMTQQDVADYLGWTARSVSEAERSWDSGRTREFDAQLLVHLGIVFGVPVVAFFLPPEGQAGEGLYFAAPDGDPRNMTDLFWMAMHDSDDESSVLTAYRLRFREAAGRFLDPQWRKEVARWFGAVTGAAALRERAALLRAKAAKVRESGDDVAADLEAFADEMEKAAEGEDDAEG